MHISFHDAVTVRGGALVFLCFEGQDLSSSAKEFDAQNDGILTKAFAVNRFQGKKKEILLLNAPLRGDVDRLVVVGLGDKSKVCSQTLTEAGGVVWTALSPFPDTKAVINVGALGLTLTDAQCAVHLAAGVKLRSYRFDLYRTKLSADKKPALTTLEVITTHAAEASRHFDCFGHITEGVFLTRTLANEPPNVLYPETMAQRLLELESYGVKVQVLDLAALKKLGMGALLGVAQGSIQQPRVVVMEWHGGDEKEAPVAFVGKGVTFDSGGISIKPAAGMEEMKFDMAGAAAVAGVMRSLAGRKAKVNAVGVVGLVENMPSGSAQRPSDIVTTMSGQTAEVLNTDAEGRLVLADVLWYTQDRFKPKVMINLATLTGAIVIALGDYYGGLFSNNDDLSEKLLKSSRTVGEDLWRLPLDERYDREIDSDVADVKNLGAGRKAGSAAGAQFLQRFVNNVPWAHLDIAGVAWTEKPQVLCAKGPTGYGVRLLDQLVHDHYEG